MAFIGVNTDEGPITWTEIEGGGLWVSNHLSVFTHDKFVGSVYSNVAGLFGVLQAGKVEDFDLGYAVTNFTASQSGSNLNEAITIDASTPTGFSEELILPYVRLYFAYVGEEAPTTVKIYGKAANAGVKY